jgi:hypothetical protein
MFVNSVIETQIEPGKPLQMTNYLEVDAVGFVGCLKITQAPAVLVLYKPDDLMKTLWILSSHFGKITYYDKKAFVSMQLERMAK